MATSYQEAVEKTIIASEQLNQIVNGTATAEVVVEDGSKIPSVRKALVDNFYFKDPLPWQQGQTETVFNQLRKFSDGTLWYAPTATTSNVVTMGFTPVGDPLWKVYSLDAIPKLTPQIREALRRSYAEAGFNLVAGSFELGGVLVNPNDVLLQSTTGKAFTGPAGVVPAGTNPASGGFADVSETLRDHQSGRSIKFASIGAFISAGDLLFISGKVHDTYPHYSGVIESINFEYNEIKLKGNQDQMIWFTPGTAPECRFKNAALIADFSRRLRMHIPSSVAWYGDSNSALNNAQVQKSFAAMINNSYGSGTVSVIDRAVSGRTAEWEFKGYTTPPNSNLSIIALGTNDAIYDRYLNGFDEIKSYEIWMRKLIEREIEWGAGVVIVSPLPARFDKQFESYTAPAPTDPFGNMPRPDIKALRCVAERLAIEYGCPFFDSDEWMSRYTDDAFANQTQSIGGPQSPFGDSIHLTASYATAWGLSIAFSIMCDNVVSPKRVTGGSLLQVRPNIDPVVFSGGKGKFPYTWGGNADVRFASGDSILNERALVIQNGEKLTYAFYAEEPVICYPVLVTVSGDPCVIAYDQYAVLDQQAVDVNKIRKSKSGFSGKSDVSIRAGLTVTTESFPQPCNIYSVGWHAITFTAAKTGVAWVSGLVFDSISIATKNLRAEVSAIRENRNLTTLPDSVDVGTLRKTDVYFAGAGASNKFWGNKSVMLEVTANTYETVVVQKATEFGGDIYVRQLVNDVWSSPRVFSGA